MKPKRTIKLFLAASFCGMFLTAQTFAQKPKTPRKARASASAPIGGTADIKPAKKPEVKAAVSKVRQINAAELKKILTPNGKPLLVNFWATWCEPCREEFPDLVKINADYQGKLDVALISLDDLAEINRDVPVFLKEMKAEMPAFLLKVPDEETAIAAVSKDWQGGLPFTILYDAQGKTVLTQMGKVKASVLREKIESLMTAK